MAFKSKINEWCLIRRAKPFYNICQVPDQKYLCTLDITASDGTIYTFTPQQANTKKKMAENDAAEMGYKELSQIKNEKEDFAHILQAMCDAIRCPCRNENTAVIELLIEAFELSDGWINAEYFLIFQGVRTAISRTDSSSRRENKQCLNILNAACEAFVSNDPVLNKCSVFETNIVRDSIFIEKRNYQYFVRRINPVSDEERELLALISNKKATFDDVDTKDEEELPPKQSALIAVVLSADPAVLPREFKIDLHNNEGLMKILNRFTMVLQASNVMTVPIYSREHAQEQKPYFTAGIRIFTKANAIGDVNRVASWLSGSKVIGDVVIGYINLGFMKDFTLTSLSHLVSSSLPSGLLFKDTDFLSLLPTKYLPSLWNQTENVDNTSENSKLSESVNIATSNPHILLHQIVSRRLDAHALTTHKVTIKEAAQSNDRRAVLYLEKVAKHGELITVDILSRQNDDDEAVPSNPLWEKGIINPKLTKSVSADKIAKSIKTAIAAANPIVCRVEIHLPCSLFGGAGSIVVFKNVRLDGEPLTKDICLSVGEALDICALNCLHLIQKFAESELKGLPSIVPDLDLCPDIMAATNISSVFFQMKIGQDTKTFSCFLGIGMMLPSIENALMEMSVSSSKTISIAPGELPSDLMLILTKQSFEITLIDKAAFECALPVFKITESFASSKRFSPSLQDQRRRFVSTFLRAVEAKTWADLGCGDGSLMLDSLIPIDKVTYVPNLKKLAAIDVNPKRLAFFSKQFESIKSDYQYDSITNVSIFEGTICEPDFYDLLNNDLGINTYDVVTCIEVIEHLPTVQDATIAASLTLLKLRPKFLIVSTPNYEANEAIQLLPSKVTSTEKRVEEIDDQNPKKISFREADHKFEFTRAEFKEWVESILVLTKNKYRAEYSSVGNLLPGNERFGGATQIVIFVRCEDILKPDQVFELDALPCKMSFSWNSQS